MLYIPGQNPDTARAIEDVLSRSTPELTPSGFEYFVSPDSEPMSLSIGVVYRTVDQSDLTIIVHGSIPIDNRQQIAGVAVAGESHLDKGSYWIAEAAQEVIGWDSPQAFKENISTINLLFDSITRQRRYLREHPNLDNETKRRLDLEAKCSIGWLAMHRGISDAAVEAQERLVALGLAVPHADYSDIELKGKLQTKRGSVNASFKAMTEKDDRHTCACCSGQLIKHSSRMTLGLERNDGHSDHHHYHIPCFDVTILPKFDVSTIRVAPITLG